MKVGILGTGKIVQEFLRGSWNTRRLRCRHCAARPAAPKRHRSCADSMACRSTPPTIWSCCSGWMWCTLPCPTCSTSVLRGWRWSRETRHCRKAAAPSAAQTEELVALARHKKVDSCLRPSPPSIWKITPRSGSCCPGWARSAGAVQFQPVFQPVRRLLRRRNAPRCSTRPVRAVP